MPVPFNPSRPRLHRLYRGRAGVPAEPHKPWSQRKLAILQHVEAKGGSIQVNRTWCATTTSNAQHARDLRRLIQEGLLDDQAKLYTSRRTSYRQLTLTEKGKAAIPTAPQPRVSEPYAKRNADLALMTQA